MRLKVIGSNSAGNAYLLYNDEVTLLIEAGVRFPLIQQAVKFNWKKVVACLVTHEHGDHAISVPNVLKAGVDVYATKGTHEALGTLSHHRSKVIRSLEQFWLPGGFSVKPFKINHDVKEPVGFLINHAETGLVLFMTDTYMNEFLFPPLNNVIIEANYAQDIIDSRLLEGADPKILRDRTIQSHMSLDTCIDVLRSQDLTAVNNIVLIHLSDRTSDEQRFKREVTEATGKLVHVAVPGLDIPFNKNQF